ncbi:MAG: BON domain-containing protein [Candidatus Zixiibacteriota bacterium]|nr:MAG: BON domain-containing protein [candidate division Zixibacteria bacterium]
MKPGFRSDVDIEDAVRRHILNSAVIESQGLTVTCAGGKVTLSGMVDSLGESEEAGLLASEVRGVRDVKNNILIKLKRKHSGQEIKNDAVAALERDVYLIGLPITVTVKDTVITLTGSVGNFYEKERATEEVRWIMNVSGVKNKLKVEWSKNCGVRKDETWPSADALKKALRAELDQDSRVDASGITVKAAYGHVIVDGFVSDDYQKRIAEQDVRDVVGVRWVTSNLLVTADQREDRAVRDDVQFNLDTDFTLEGFNLHTKVKDGVVTLSGSVHAWNKKRYAGDVATRVRGVRKVINNIKVVRERRHSDAALIK